jgi:predicted AlkP superfamily phosphohydrolase/phosphomutase
VTKKRVLIIGLDGATLDLVKPWVAEGKLPHLARMMQEGVHGPLRSVIPTVSPPAWTTFMTGQNPGRHGIYDFITRAPDSYQLQSSRRDLSQLRTMFGVLSQAEKQMGVINVPLTYPPEKVNGFMVSGLKSPWRGRWTYPPELQERLQAQGYWIDLRVGYRRGKNEAAFIQDMLDTAEMRVQAALGLLDEVDWDLFLVVFRGTDDALMLWHLHDPTHPLHDSELARKVGDGIEQVYCAMDDCVGRLLDGVDPGTDTFIISDHGGGPIYRDVYLNNWLHEHGWLEFKRQAPATSGFKSLLRRLGVTRELGWKFFSPENLARVKRLFPFLDQWVPEPTTTLAEMVDWECTQAYSFGYIGQIYINLRGREPQGTVEPGAEYDRLVKQIRSALLEWKDPDDGLPIVDAVYHKGELYSGPNVDRAPDLCLIMRDLSYVTHLGQEFATRSTLGPPSYTGTHRLDGLLIAGGEDIRFHTPVEGASLADIAPTLLYLLDVPIPTDLDGHVLTEILDPALLKERPVRYDTATRVRPSEFMPDEWTTEDEEQMIEHLKSLGYVD